MVWKHTDGGAVLAIPQYDETNGCLNENDISYCYLFIAAGVWFVWKNDFLVRKTTADDSMCGHRTAGRRMLKVIIIYHRAISAGK